MGAHEVTMNTKPPDLARSIKTWIFVGCAFSLFYLAFAVYEFGKDAPLGHGHVYADVLDRPVMGQVYGLAGLLTSALIGTGSLLAHRHQYSHARVCWLIGGILGLPLGIVMLIAARKIKKAGSPPS